MHSISHKTKIGQHNRRQRKIIRNKSSNSIRREKNIRNIGDKRAKVEVPSTSLRY